MTSRKGANLLIFSFLILFGNGIAQINYFVRSSTANNSTSISIIEQKGQFRFWLKVADEKLYYLVDNKLILGGKFLSSDSRDIIFPNKYYTTGNGLIYEVQREIKGLIVYDLKCEAILVNSDSLDLFLNSTEMKELKIIKNLLGNSKLKRLIVNNSTLKSLIFTNVDFLNNIEFINLDNEAERHTIIDTISIVNCNILTDLSFGKIPMPRFINLKNVNFESGHSSLDLSGFNYLNKDSICKIKIEDLNDGISKLKLNYEFFKLIYNETPDWKIEGVFKYLLEGQLKQGYINGYQKLDKDYKHYQYTKDNSFLGEFKDWIDKTWWDYGYNKFKVITNSVWVFLFILVINILLYSHMLEVYFPLKFKKIEEYLVDRFGDSNSFISRVKFHIYRIPSIFVYTAYLFWGIRLDIKEIELKRPLVFIILLVEYVLGIICIAYIANYIISK